ALEVASDHGVRFGELGDALLGGALALAAHVIDEALAVQRRADHAGGGLERRELRRIDSAALAGAVEAHDADELARYEDRHDGLRAGADALDAGAALLCVDLGGAEAHAAPGAKLRAHGRKVALLAREPA